MKPENDKNVSTFNWIDLVKSVWFLLDKQKKKFAFWSTILVLINFYSIVPPLILGRIVDFFTGFTKGDSLLPFIILASTLGLSYAFISFMRLSTKQVLGNIRSEVVYFIKVRGFENLLNFSLRWHDEENTGAKVKKIENGIGAYKSLMSRMNNDLIGAITTFTGVITVFIFLNPKYVIFFVLYVIIFFGILKYFYQRIQKANEDFSKAMEKAGGSYVEGLSNILTIKTLGASESFKTHIAQKEELTKKHDYYMRFLGISLWRSFQVFNGLCYGSFLLLVGFGVANGEISPGSIVVYSFIFYR